MNKMYSRFCGKNASIRRLIVPILTTIALLQPTSVLADTYYIAKDAGGGGNGSEARPWDGVRAAIRSGSIKGGDTIIFKPGQYGRLKFHDVTPDSMVTFKTEGPGVHVTELEVARSQNLSFDGFQVWPLKRRGDNQSLVRAGHSSRNIHFRNFDLRSGETTDYVNWSLRDWRERQISGFLLNGPDVSVTDSTLTGIGFGIAVTGKNARVERNTIYGFSGDGIRGLGDNTHIIGNHIKDCVKIDGNHDDGLQSWTLGKGGKVGAGIQKDLHIIGNQIEEWTGDPKHPLICDLQGMLFGHRLHDLVITNNIVAVSAYHGISAAGITRGLIANNTLVNSRGPSSKAPWIGVLGGGSRQVTMANNITPAFSIPGHMSSQIRENMNVQLIYSARELVDPLNQNYDLKPGSGLIGRAIPELATTTDFYGNPRGAAPDVGALQHRP